MDDNTRILLIAQMRRAIELLESEDILKPVKTHDGSNWKWLGTNREHTELKVKLHEIRRDSVRLIKDCKAN